MVPIRYDCRHICYLSLSRLQAYLVPITTKIASIIGPPRYRILLAESSRQRPCRRVRQSSVAAIFSRYFVGQIQYSGMYRTFSDHTVWPILVWSGYNLLIWICDLLVPFLAWVKNSDFEFLKFRIITILI